MSTPTLAPFITRRRYFEFVRKGRVIQAPIDRFSSDVNSVFRDVERTVAPTLEDNVHGWRKGRSVATAVNHIEHQIGSRLSFDIVDFFPSIEVCRLSRMLNRLNPVLWPRIVPYLGPTGVPNGFPFSPMLANLYLSEIDRRFPIVRYCDNIMVIADDPHRTFLKIERHLGDIGLRSHKVEMDPARFCGQTMKPADPKEVIPLP